MAKNITIQKSFLFKCNSLFCLLTLPPFPLLTYRTFFFFFFILGNEFKPFFHFFLPNPKGIVYIYLKRREISNNFFFIKKLIKKL